MSSKVFTGTVHCKSSFYAREFGAGPKSEDNKAYINLLTRCGVLATEMETAALFIQSQLYNYQLMKEGKGSDHHVLAGAVLAIVSTPPEEFASDADAEVTIDEVIKLAFEAVRIISVGE